MIHPDTQLCWISPAIGHGVRATRRIPRGTLTWVRCRLDRVLTPAEVDALGPLYRPSVERYAYIDHRGHSVLCWDAGRHVNHHCRANSRALGLDAQIAIRDIEAGEELSCDYGECNLEAALSCECRDPECRGTITAADLWRLAATWDREVREALTLAGELIQPLLPYSSDPGEIAEILAGRRTPVSIRALAPTG